MNRRRFWGIEAYVKKLPGVSSTDVGYANGNTENPSYKEVCYNNTGHAETVKVVYDTSLFQGGGSHQRKSAGK